MPLLIPFRLEFHVSRQARDFYQFDQAPFTFSGNVIFADFHSARLFTQKINERRDLIRYPEQALRAGQVNAMGLIDEILHLVIEQYRRERNPDAMGKAIAWLETHLGANELQKALDLFVEQFPPLAVYKRQLSVEEYLQGFSQRPDGSLVSNHQLALEEMLMLWLANMNPAFAPFLELYDDQRLEKNSAYLPIIQSLHDFFEN